MNTAHSMVTDFNPSGLADIYQSDVSIAIWQRQLDSDVTRYAQHLMTACPNLQTRFIQQPHNITDHLELELPLIESRQAFIEDLGLVVRMFGDLFELKNVGIRLNVLRRAMCPKFHVDRVPCRLISTYAGVGTQWLPPEDVDRLAGRVTPKIKTTPNNLALGDVALLKGEAWEGNEGNGLVHRSPSATEETPRLVLTLDFI